MAITVHYDRPKNWNVLRYCPTASNIAINPSETLVVNNKGINFEWAFSEHGIIFCSFFFLLLSAVWLSGWLSLTVCIGVYVCVYVCWWLLYCCVWFSFSISRRHVSKPDIQNNRQTLVRKHFLNSKSPGNWPFWATFSRSQLIYLVSHRKEGKCINWNIYRILLNVVECNLS